MSDIDHLFQKDDSKDDYWSVTLAKMVLQKVAWTHPEAKARVESFEIVNDEYQDFAAQLLREIKAEWKTVEDERKKITKPLLEAKQKTDALFKPALTALEDVERLLKQKIAAYLATKQAANVAALQAASVAPTALAASQSIDAYEPVQAPQGVSVRQVWKFEVLEPELVPREFCSPDAKKIGAVDPKLTQIPGVRFFQEDVVTVRTK